MLGKPNVKLHSDEKEKSVFEAFNIWTVNNNPNKKESYIISQRKTTGNL